MDWVHCNSCFFLPGQMPKREFLVTSCGHIFCKSCERQGAIEQCKVCSAKGTSISLTAEMDKEVQAYFDDTEVNLGKILKVQEFQKSNRMKLNEHFRKVGLKYQLAKVHIQRIEEENKALKKKLEIYKRNHSRASVLTPPPTTNHQYPLFCKNSQVTKAIQRSVSQPSPQSPQTPTSPFFATPSRPSYASQQYRSVNYTPATPASSSSGSPYSVKSGLSCRSQNSVERKTPPGLSQSYKPNYTPPINSLRMLTVHAPKNRNMNARY